MQYSEKVRRYFYKRDKVGEISTGAEHLKASDDKLDYEVHLDVACQDGQIDQVRYRLYGEPNLVAALAWYSDYLEGKATSELTPLDPMQLAQELEIPITKLYAPILIQTLHQTLMERII